MILFVSHVSVKVWRKRENVGDVLEEQIDSMKMRIEIWEFSHEHIIIPAAFRSWWRNQKLPRQLQDRTSCGGRHSAPS